MDPVDRLILDESPEHAHALLVLDAPDLATPAAARADRVSYVCDDLRDQRRLPRDRHERLSADVVTDVDLVWLRLPKGLNALDEVAETIANHAAAGVRVIAGGRVKHLTHTMNDVLAKHFTEVSASLGRQKSRVLRASGPIRAEPTWPRRAVTDLGVTLVAHGRTFAGTRVDAGSALLISRLAGVPGGDVLDFGSGNGVLATLLARDPGRRVRAIDVSAAAVDSTLATAAANGVRVAVEWADGIAHLPAASLDAIVTNPPFHAGTARESTPTLEMFAQAGRVLRAGGELWCVYNSHLPWRSAIARFVGPVGLVAQNRRYTLVRAVRP